MTVNLTLVDGKVTLYSPSYGELGEIELNTKYLHSTLSVPSAPINEMPSLFLAMFLLDVIALIYLLSSSFGHPILVEVIWPNEIYPELLKVKGML